jgi:hypothetical protein
MSPPLSNVEIKKSKILWFILIAVMVCITSIIWLLRVDAPTPAVAAVSQSPLPRSPAMPFANTASTRATLSAQQAAVTAASHDTHAQPINGKVQQRPDFVSEIEWQTLNMIAQKSPTPDQELTRLVSNMRFNKQMEIWQSLASTPDQTQRHALATQLLADIPNAVMNQAMDKAQAQQTQNALLDDLERDPHIRQQRIAQEAARIGVKFEVQESP